MKFLVLLSVLALGCCGKWMDCTDCPDCKNCPGACPIEAEKCPCDSCECNPCEC